MYLYKSSKQQATLQNVGTFQQTTWQYIPEDKNSSKLKLFKKKSIVLS
jgi:hypothetical protein